MARVSGAVLAAEQFRAWRLTPAEREVALLLLKGRSHKEIAAATGRSERTVRQHAIAAYQKAGLGGRAELAAFLAGGADASGGRRTHGPQGIRPAGVGRGWLSCARPNVASCSSTSDTGLRGVDSISARGYPRGSTSCGNPGRHDAPDRPGALEQAFPRGSLWLTPPALITAMTPAFASR